MDLLLKNCQILDPSVSDKPEEGDILIRGGVIAEIGAALSSDCDTRDLDGATVTPGLFDMHVHFREPGQSQKETIASGTAAAAQGGFTGVCCMPNTEPAISDPFVISYIKEKARGGIVDVEICGTMTKERHGEELAPMEALAEAGVRMVSDDGGAVRSAEMMRHVFEYAKMFDLLVTQHCEEHSMTVGAPMNEGAISTKLGLPGWPSVAEEIIISRDILLCEFVGGVRYHVAHMTTKNGVRLVREAKARGVQVSCEVTPHHLVLTESAIEQYGTMAKMNPPLRTQEDIDALYAGLADGTIDCIATDHAPHSQHEKETDIIKAAFGIIGLETAVGIGLTYLVRPGRLSLAEFIRKSSTNPRALLKLKPIQIKAGERANMTVIAHEAHWKFEKKDIRSKSHNTPFLGFEFVGKVVGVVNNNQARWTTAD